MNLRSLRANLRQVIIDMDLLALNTNVNKSVFAFQTPAQRLQQFSQWLETAALAALDAHWWVYPFINKALASGLYRASQEVPGNEWFPQPDTFANLHALAKSEIRGILAALVQKTTRTAHAAMARGADPVAAFHEMAKPFDHDIRDRLVMFTHYITVKAHAQAKLAVYKNNGITQIGIDPETQFVQKDGLVQDAKKKNARHGFSERHRVRRNRQINQSENYVVGWGTAGDELVCDECQEMADGSPYTIDDIEDLFPLHVNCRCAPYPWPADQESGDLFDDEEPGHPFRGNQYSQGESGGHPSTVHVWHATLTPTHTPSEGSHFGSKEAAMQRVHDLYELPPESRPFLTPRNPDPVLHEVELTTGKVVELPDNGEWWPGEMAMGMRNAGVMSAGEYDALEAKEFDFDPEEYLRSKGFDTIAYRNSWENKGSYSYIPLRAKNIRYIGRAHLKI